jgi:hypothetical protein
MRRLGKFFATVLGRAIKGLVDQLAITAPQAVPPALDRDQLMLNAEAFQSQSSASMPNRLEHRAVIQPLVN